MAETTTEADGGWYDNSPVPLFPGSWAMRDFWAVRLADSNCGWMNVNLDGGQEAFDACR